MQDPNSLPANFEDTLFEAAREKERFEALFNPAYNGTPEARQFLLAWMIEFYRMTEKEAVMEFEVRGIKLTETDIIEGLSRIR